MKQDNITSACPITGTLATYTNWGTNQNSTDPQLAKLRDIQHLFNRMTLGANRMDIEWALTKTPEQVVNRLVDLAVEEIGGQFTIPAPGLNVHPWGDKRGFNDCEMISKCASIYHRSLAIKKEFIHGLIGGNHPLNPIYTPNNGTKTVLDQEKDRAKRFKYKMAWFWSNHFVVHENANNDGNGMMWYKFILVYNALGNFKAMAKDIGLSQIMLSYLDASYNFYRGNPNWEPNENYARELLELFTMGVADGSPGDYTLYDIEQISKVFSGWRSESWAGGVQKFREYTFQPNLHDWNTKTIFGVTYTPTPDPSIDTTSHNSVSWPQNLGTDPDCPAPAGCNDNYVRYSPLDDHPNCFIGDKNTFEISDAYAEYEKVHDIIFGDFTGPETYNQGEMSVRKHRIAKFICTKIYKFFVYENVDANGEAVIDLLATIFETNWEIAPVVRVLLKSEHFFNTNIRGARIKSHLGSALGLHTTMGVEYNSDYFLTDQFFDANHYDPNDPYGYPNTTIPKVEPDTIRAYEITQWRVGRMGHQLFQPPNVAGFPGYRAWINEYSLLKLGDELSNIVNHHFSDSRISIQQKWRDFLLEISGNSSDPVVIVQAVAQHFVIVDMNPEQVDRAVIAFKWTIPANYFTDGTWNLNYNLSWTFNQYRSLVGFLVKQPEFYMS